MCVLIFSRTFIRNIFHSKKNSARHYQKFKVCKSVHHQTIQINQPPRCNNFSSLLLDVYVQLNMFRASPRPTSGAQQIGMNQMLKDIRLALHMCQFVSVTDGNEHLQSFDACATGVVITLIIGSLRLSVCFQETSRGQ
jgi:hypothetical protein